MPKKEETEAMDKATTQVLAILTQNLREGWKPVPDYDRHVDSSTSKFYRLRCNR
jgi:hypothetical protein